MPKWKAVVVDDCLKVFQVLVHIRHYAGVIPEGNKLRGMVFATTAEKLLGYADRVLNNEAFWSGLPAMLKPSPQAIRNVQDAHRMFLKAIKSSEAKIKTELTLIREKMEREEQRDELRKALRKTLLPLRAK